MSPVSLTSDFASAPPPVSSGQEDQNIWFDNAIDHVEMDEALLRMHEGGHADPSSSAAEVADLRVPFTEDCRRGVQQFVRTLGNYAESKMLSACLSKILPGTPSSLVIAANSLYTAITERRNIDFATLHALGLASWLLPDSINVVSRLGAFIQDAVTGWTDDTFLQGRFGDEDDPTSTSLFTALAVTAIVAGRCMKDSGSPQRGPFKVPAFIANIFIRASHYWTALGNMASSLPSSVEMRENAGLSRRVPAFEVDTQVEMTGDACEATVPCSSSTARLTAFSSNSTAFPGAYTQATVQNRLASAPGENYSISVPGQAHSLAVDKLRLESGLSALSYCTTLKTETRQQVNERVVTATRFNTRCDAITYPEPLMKPAERTHVFADTPETQMVSSATSRGGADTLLPLVISATVPVASPYMTAMKGNTFIAAGTAAGLTGLTLGGKLLWDTLSRHNPEGKRADKADSTENGPLIATETDAELAGLMTGRKLLWDKMSRHSHESRHADKTNNIENSSHMERKENNKVIKTLVKKGLLGSGGVNKDKLLSAVAEYIFGNEKGIAGSADKIQHLARKILSAVKLYGGNKGESLSNVQAESIVRTWVFNNVLGTSPVEYIINNMMDDAYPGYYTIDSIHHLLSVNLLLKHKLLNYDNYSGSQWGYLNAMWHLFLREEMPFLKFTDKSVRSLELNSFDFADLYSGSRFLQMLSAGDYTWQDAMATGDAMWKLAVSDGVSIADLTLFSAPALFFANEKRIEGFNHDIEAINRYVKYRKEVVEVKMDVEEKYGRYIAATKNWLNKIALAKNIISQCSVLPPGLDDRGDAIRNPAQRREKAEKFALQNYLNGFLKPCDNAPERLDDEYSKLTGYVANSFRELDKYLILSAISELPNDEQAFISLPGAKIYPASIKMHTNRGTHSTYGVAFNNDINVSLNCADLFSVRQKGDERIYALKAINGGQEGYQLIRVDHDINKYIHSGILDHDFGSEYISGTSKVESGGDTFSYSFYTDKTAIAIEGDNVKSLVRALSSVHRDALYRVLYESGNDKSDFTKIVSVVKHMIPFYDCVEGIVNNDPGQAIPACLMDAVAFIPVFGQAASLGGKFGTGLARGLRSGINIVGREGIKTAGKNLLWKVSLPTTEELAALGKSALLAADPGFALAGGITRRLGRRIENLLSANKKTTYLGKRIISLSEAGRLLQPPLVNPVMLTLPGSSLHVPAIKTGVKNGICTYVRINMETGEKFGKYFHLDAKEESVLIKQNHVVSKNLANKITPDMHVTNLDIKKLTPPNFLGVMLYENGKKYIKVNQFYVEVKERGGSVFIKSNAGGVMHLEYRNGEIHVESHVRRLARLKKAGFNGTKTKPEELIAVGLNVSKEKAKEILSKYEFPNESELYTEGTFALSVREVGAIPEWAKSFEKINAKDYSSPFRESSIMGKGLRGFHGKDGYFYRVDINPPETVLEKGFAASRDYTAISKMLPDDVDGVIASESLEGAQRYQSLIPNSYIYQIKGENIEGVSLKNNLYLNEEGLNDFLKEEKTKKHPTIDSLAEDTNGAIYLDEVHLKKESISLDAISLVAEHKLNKELLPGPWKNYF